MWEKIRPLALRVCGMSKGVGGTLVGSWRREKAKLPFAPVGKQINRNDLLFERGHPDR